MTLTIEQLESRNSRAIRRILRKFMGRTGSNNLKSDINRELKRFPSKFTEDIHKIVSNTYNEGYIDGGRQIRHRIPLTAAEFEGVEDPLVSKYTLALIDSLSLIIDHTKDEMVEDLTEWYTQGWSYNRIRNGLLDYFDDNPTSANRMARTMTNDIFNRAAEQRYVDSGVVEGIEYSAFIDNRTSEICRMLDGTIWALGDPDIRRPPRHFNCYDSSTDVLTDRGFKRFSNLTTDDKVLSLNPFTTEIEYVKPDEIIKYHHNGDMIHLKSRSYDLLVTLDHNIPYYSKWDMDQGRRVMRFKEAQSIGVSDRIPLTGIWNGIAPDNINFGGRHSFDSALFMRFMGWYITEGNLNNKKQKNNVVISQSKTCNEDHFNEILKLGYDMGLNPRPTNDRIYMQINYELWYYLSKLGKSHEKYIPHELKQLDAHHLSILLDAAIKGDGCVHKTKSWKGANFRPLIECTTSSKQLADDYSELILKTGYRPSFTFPYEKGNHVDFKNGTYTIKHPAYHIRLLYSNFYNHHKQYKSIVPYNGMVYCASLPYNHTMYVRRNGKCTWSGNCRSRLIPYFYGIPGKRDFTKDFDDEFIAKAEETENVFLTKYWMV